MGYEKAVDNICKQNHDKCRVLMGYGNTNTLLDTRVCNAELLDDKVKEVL